jgi:hypothetical protein
MTNASMLNIISITLFRRSSSALNLEKKLYLSMALLLTMLLLRRAGTTHASGKRRGSDTIAHLTQL